MVGSGDYLDLGSGANRPSHLKRAFAVVIFALVDHVVRHKGFLLESVEFLFVPFLLLFISYLD